MKIDRPFLAFSLTRSAANHDKTGQKCSRLLQTGSSSKHYCFYNFCNCEADTTAV
ncbi:hypothetical protein T4A_11042 [Trichinella pseudospiralis]|uniref:Uncharacterized protein n=1 Tax=Trichinella pseudospiralis TaxID=6337 RepID=A0A0V1EJJ1_TRIPS|nr:hypothetical protein T4E_11787 [Trichinella pseudospiralis]KRX86711.1 hypothetical protein T4E_555 [Trichinella pseudospiralis]KRY73973.1 hypothetical protein T4A_11042 [Trichinella pseudospiralis]KRY88869.1 hypothetical protein T4D_4240 [Trichinella pseudospiralis]